MEPEDKQQEEATQSQENPETSSEGTDPIDPSVEAQAEQPTQEGDQPDTPDQDAAKLDEAKRRAADNWDKFMRLQAEFENFKKRMHKEQSESLKYAQLPVLKEMIGILDNFERAVDHARSSDAQELEGIISGIDMVIQQMRDAFGKFGMIRIKALGEPFDPTCHEAMGLKETDEVPENQVVEEFQPGYMLHDRVVRPAMVIVSKKATNAE